MTNRAFTQHQKTEGGLEYCHTVFSITKRTFGAGFTLVETIITVSMTAVIMLALANLYINFNSLYSYQQTFVATANAASSAVGAFNAAVLPANRVLASYDFSGTTLSTATTTLVLELPSMDASGNIIAGAYDYIGFYLNDTDLYERTLANASSARTTGIKRIAPLVDSLSFEFGVTDVTQAISVSAAITTSLTRREGVVQTSLQRQFYLRNK